MDDQNVWKEMGDQKKYMILACNSEKIIIETNQLSEESDSSYVSDCLSDSEYEEIELEPSSPKIGPYSDFRNPYVRLVRCDHLLADGSTLVLANDGDKIRSRTRSSLRNKRPNPYYRSGDFLLTDIAYGKHITKPNDKRQKVFKQVRKASMYSNKDNAVKIEEGNLRNKTWNFSITSSNKLPKPGEEGNQDNYTVTINDIKIERENEYQSISQDRRGDFPDHAPNEEPTLQWQDFVIKSEPDDEYFDNIIDKELQPMTENDFLNYRIKKEHTDDFFNYQNEMADVLSLPEGAYSNLTTHRRNSGVCVKVEVSGETLGHKSDKESDGSDVDVENEWDCAKFIARQKVVDFDHCYHLPNNSKGKSDDSSQTLPVQCRDSGQTKGNALVKSINPKHRVHRVDMMNVHASKERKKGVRKEIIVVCITCKRSWDGDKFLITQKPDLDMWEFPNCRSRSEQIQYTSLCKDILQKHMVRLTEGWYETNCSEAIHIYVDNHLRFSVEIISVGPADIVLEDWCRCKWVSRQKFMQKNVSSVMRMVFQAYETTLDPDKKTKQ